MKRYLKASDDYFSKYTLEVVPECDDDETGEHTCWAIRSAYPTYTENNGEKYNYIWIVKYADDEYVVENANGYNLADDKTYKTLRGATKKAQEIMWRRDESGFYND